MSPVYFMAFLNPYAFEMHSLLTTAVDIFCQRPHLDLHMDSILGQLADSLLLLAAMIMH